MGLVRCVLVSAVVSLCSLAAFAQQYDPAAEQEIFQLLNQARQGAGLPALNWDERLQRAARQHSQLMAQHQQLSHEFSGEPRLSRRLAATGIRLNNDAENVGFDDSAEAAHQGFMHSPPHRANILGAQYNAAGIGVVRQGGTLWVTEDLAHLVPERSENQAEDSIVTAFERARSLARVQPAPRIRLPQAHDLACRMARAGRLDPNAPLRLPDARSAVVYTQTEPDHLPSTALKLAADRSLGRFAVGACFASNDQYPAGTYWVVMVFY